MRVLITDGADEFAVKKIKETPGVNLDFNKGLSRSELFTKLATAEVVVIRSATTMDAEAISHAPKLKMIVRAGEGLDNVDQLAAKRKRSAS